MHYLSENDLLSVKLCSCSTLIETDLSFAGETHRKVPGKFQGEKEKIETEEKFFVRSRWIHN